MMRALSHGAAGLTAGELADWINTLACPNNIIDPATIPMTLQNITAEPNASDPLVYEAFVGNPYSNAPTLAWVAGKSSDPRLLTQINGCFPEDSAVGLALAQNTATSIVDLEAVAEHTSDHQVLSALTRRGRLDNSIDLAIAENPVTATADLKVVGGRTMDHTTLHVLTCRMPVYDELDTVISGTYFTDYSDFAKIAVRTSSHYVFLNLINNNAPGINEEIMALIEENPHADEEIRRGIAWRRNRPFALRVTTETVQISVPGTRTLQASASQTRVPLDLRDLSPDELVALINVTTDPDVLQELTNQLNANCPEVQVAFVNNLYSNPLTLAWVVDRSSDAALLTRISARNRDRDPVIDMPLVENPATVSSDLLVIATHTADPVVIDVLTNRLPVDDALDLAIATNPCTDTSRHVLTRDYITIAFRTRNVHVLMVLATSIAPGINPEVFDFIAENPAVTPEILEILKERARGYPPTSVFAVTLNRAVLRAMHRRTVAALGATAPLVLTASSTTSTTNPVLLWNQVDKAKSKLKSDPSAGGLLSTEAEHSAYNRALDGAVETYANPGLLINYLATQHHTLSRAQKLALPVAVQVAASSKRNNK